MQSFLAGLAFLVIGDSRFASKNYLISTLQDGLVEEGASVNTFGAYGVPARTWDS